MTVAAVPWARHGAGHTRAFDDLVAWFATRMSKTALARYLRVGWATVGAIIARVMADADAAAAGDAGDRLDGITRIGVDEISYKRGYMYLTVVVDHATRRVLWLAEGRPKSTLAQFFTLLGPTAPPRSSWSPPTALTGSSTPSGTPARTLISATIRSTWSRGPRRPGRRQPAGQWSSTQPGGVGIRRACHGCPGGKHHRRASAKSPRHHA